MKVRGFTPFISGDVVARVFSTFSTDRFFSRIGQGSSLFDHRRSPLRRARPLSGIDPSHPMITNGPSPSPMCKGLLRQATSSATKVHIVFYYRSMGANVFFIPRTPTYARAPST
jgi:hypothetical protein